MVIGVRIFNVIKSWLFSFCTCTRSKAVLCFVYHKKYVMLYRYVTRELPRRTSKAGSGLARWSNLVPQLGRKTICRVRGIWAGHPTYFNPNPPSGGTPSPTGVVVSDSVWPLHLFIYLRIH